MLPIANMSHLMQRYDPDPAATVLASKTGADSGSKAFSGNEPQVDPSSGKSNDMEVSQSRGLRNRRQLKILDPTVLEALQHITLMLSLHHSGTSERFSRHHRAKPADVG